MLQFTSSLQLFQFISFRFVFIRFMTGLTQMDIYVTKMQLWMGIQVKPEHSNNITAIWAQWQQISKKNSM